jgi:protein-S-isoprenylcysteine O-methyltransferase Ste14
MTTMPKPGFNEKHQISRNAIKEDLLQFALPALLIFTVGLFVTFIHILLLLGDSQPLFTLSLLTLLGLAFIITGYTLAFAARATLRRYYSSSLVIRQDHQLITHGAYRLCRHPIYFGVLLVAIGLPLLIGSLPGMLIMFCLVPVVLNRIRLEERLLTEQFGDAYRTYSETTRKLIPYIY